MDNNNNNHVIIGTVAAVISATIAVLTYFNIKPVSESSEPNNAVQKVSKQEQGQKPTVMNDTVFRPENTAVAAKAVDIGLSVKWAEWNVGAHAPEEFGDYYAWGEIEVKRNYSIRKYKWCRGWYYTMKKYCTNNKFSRLDKIDGKTVLDTDDDVASVKWGGDWRIPTFQEVTELLLNCKWTWSVKNGINGYIVTGPNGNSIFLPAAGYRVDKKLFYTGENGSYISSNLYEELNFDMMGFSFDPNEKLFFDGSRSNGYSVRPVCK